MNRIIILFITLCCIAACKKPSSSPYPSDTYFRAYGNIPLDISTGNQTTFLNASPIVSDPEGNMYVEYTARGVPGANNPSSIMKTDKYGNIIWNKKYFLFTTYATASFYGNVYSANFVCSGQNLYLLVLDTTYNWTILTFSCSDGQYLGQAALAGLVPANGTAGSLSFLPGGISATKEGNILAYAHYSLANGNNTPFLALLNPQGGVIWTKTDYPDSLPPNVNNGEYGNSICQLSDGSFEFGAIIGRNFNITADSESQSSTMVFYHLSSTGNLMGEDSLPAGANVLYLNTYVTKFYNWTGFVTLFFIFPSPTGGFIIVANEFDEYQYYRIKIIKTDPSFVATDSIYISNPNGLIGITGVAQQANGNIVLSASQNLLTIRNVLSFFYQVTPDLSIIKQQEIGLPSQSLFIGGVNITNDGYILMNGQIQTYGLDTNHLFILKADGNGHF